jgi:hypothetical protein
LCSFEKTLKQKLSQKASGATNEETVLLKAFKYFDLNNNGTVEPDEFAKAVEKIGIMIPTRQVSCGAVRALPSQQHILASSIANFKLLLPLKLWRA